MKLLCRLQGCFVGAQERTLFVPAPLSMRLVFYCTSTTAATCKFLLQINNDTYHDRREPLLIRRARLTHASSRSLCRVRRRARSAGLCHGEVFAFCALDEGVAEGDQSAEGGKVPQHLLFSVRTPLHCGSGAYCNRNREVVDPGSNLGRRRAALGRAGAFDALPGLQEEWILHSGFRWDQPARNFTARPSMDFSEYDSPRSQYSSTWSEITPKPEEMKQDAYERTLRARAFDISRYLLPLATNTSLGQIVNARTLESQVARLLADTHREIRHLGELLKNAALSPAYNVNHESLQRLIEKIREIAPELAAQAEEQVLREVRVAPTLVKYADPSEYEIAVRQELRKAAAELMNGSAITPADTVDLLDEEPLEVELATTLLYEHCDYPYRQIRDVVEDSGEKIRREIIDLALRHRGKHDEMQRAFCAGQQFRFDILMDIGGFRDMHRHRRCVQIGQGFTTRHGYDTPPELRPAGALGSYDSVMKRTREAVEQLADGTAVEGRENSEYAIPLAFRKRTMFKMDFAEVVYISELRTGLPGISLIGMSRMRCTKPWLESIRR